ncbi:MAG: hypothetical protein HONBIEJF_02803 [Fimbriimonadaceae bacterium]|nr:hypothetical protein [Fimbriimonadaceae bacterium]
MPPLLRNRILTAVAIIHLISTSFAQSSDKLADPPLDRTGEKELRQIFQDFGKLKSLEVSLIQWTREVAEGPDYLDHSLDLWYGGGTRFRVDYMSMWGDGFRVWSDGVVFVRDSFEMPQRLTLMDAQQAIDSMLFQLAPGGQAGSLLYVMLDGERGFGRTVDEKTPIFVRDLADGRRSIEFVAKQQGATQLILADVQGATRVVEIRFDNRRNREGVAPLKAKWFDAPDHPIVIQRIDYRGVNGRVNGKLFDTNVGQGAAVDDRRKKKTATR